MTPGSAKNFKNQTVSLDASKVATYSSSMGKVSNARLLHTSP